MGQQLRLRTCFGNVCLLFIHDCSLPICFLSHIISTEMKPTNSFLNLKTMFFRTLLLVVSLCTIQLVNGNDWRTHTHADRDESDRKNNLVVNGIDETEDENINQIVEDLGRKLDIENPLQDVVRVYRRICRKKPRPIVICLTSHKIRVRWILAYRARRLWTEKLFVSEHLPKQVRELEIDTRRWAQSRNYTTGAVWVWRAQVFYRKHKESPRYRVLDHAHLYYLIRNETAEELIQEGNQQWVPRTIRIKS
uniref:Uncharacterized protein n=1 Tax=Cacopsylla melanoneura TaxID=428564 RepID=A0A8D9E5G0_9HEMI